MSDTPEHPDGVPEPEPEEPQLTLAVAAASGYVSGFPIHVALQIGVEPADTFGEIPPPRFLRLGPSIGFRVVDADGETVAEQVERPPPVDPVSVGSMLEVSSEVPARILIDLSERLDHRTPPGTYTLHVRYAAPPDVADAESIPLVVREPEGAEQRLLEELMPEVRAAGSWGQWSVERPGDSPRDLLAPITRQHPGRLNDVLRRMVFAELHRLPINQLDVLDGLYAPEARVLRAELHRMRGEEDAAKTLLDEARRETPALTWWIQAVEEGDGVVTAWRDLLSDPGEEP